MRLLALIFAFCAGNVLAATSDTPAAAAPSAEEQRLEMMQTFTYSDEKQCYAVVQAGEEPRPVLNLLVASYGLPDVDNALVQAALEAVIARGCDVNVLGKSGLSPLHEAVLFNEVELVRFLLANGASMETKIERPNSEIDGMNAQQFLDKLLLLAAEQGDTRDRSAVQALLAEHLKQQGKNN